MGVLTEVTYHMCWALDSFHPKTFDRLIRRTKDIVVDAPTPELRPPSFLTAYYDRGVTNAFAEMVRANRQAVRTVAEVLADNRDVWPGFDSITPWVRLRRLVDLEKGSRANVMSHVGLANHRECLAAIGRWGQKRVELLKEVRRFVPTSAIGYQRLLAASVVLAAGFLLYSVLSTDQGSEKISV